MIAVLWISLVLVLGGCSLPKISVFPERGPFKEKVLQGRADEKILVISIDGIISDRSQGRLLQRQPSMVQEVVAQLQRAEKDPEIKALLLKVDSPGGTVTASDILYHEISRFKERTNTKIVVAMMNLGASGGYYVSLPADWIMAHPTTITGSIGVIFARPQVSGLMEKVGLAVEVNTSGEKKDMGSPYRPPTEAETALFQELTDGMAKRFLDLVATHRNLTPHQLQQISSAQVYLAPDAQKMGLVDQIGYLNDALDKTKSLAGLPTDAKVVTYRHNLSEDDTIYKPAATALGSQLGSMAPLLAPLTAGGETGFYYIWPVVLAP